ncbi:MAG TPA: PilZ domain-containing protein [Phycisphaerales bacterium]|nr:PilZ domain-containing protein [Phycisphaerales bacterium]
MPPIRGRRAPTANFSSGSRPNTIGVPDRALDDLLDLLDGRSANSAAAAKRTHARWPFRHGSIRLTLEHPGGSLADVLVACRNLSRGGAGVLHGAYVHVGTRCTVHLPQDDGKVAAHSGTVVRCIHVSGRVHELGICFSRPIELAHFVELDPTQGASTFEKVDAGGLKGTVLAVIANDMDERIISHYLSATQLGVKFARSLKDVESLMSVQCSAIIIDLAVEDAPEALACLRRQGVDAPVIAIGDSADVMTKHQLQSMEASAFLARPLQSDHLLSALADGLLAADANALTPDPGLPAPVVESCVALVRSLADQLRGLLAENDAVRGFACCQQIRSAGLQLGLSELVGAAETAGSRVASTMSPRDALPEVEELIHTCKRVRAARRAA